MSSFDWDLYIANPAVEAEQVKNLICDRFGDDVGSPSVGVFKHDQRRSFRFEPGAAPCDFDVWDGVILKRFTGGFPDWFGFAPTLSVCGALKKHKLSGPNYSYATREESEAAGLLFVAKVLFHVLANVEGDAVIRAVDQFILLRKHGKVVVDPSRGRWSPELLALLGVDYETREIPIPED